MLKIARGDDALDGLIGAELPSEVTPNVVFRLARPMARSDMQTAFLATRVGPDGEAQVIVKVLRPSFIRKQGPRSALVVRKEAVALGRLNERVPPTPFVVRLIDVGALPVLEGDREIELAWTAVEYVPGGVLGTTLSQRVRRAVMTEGASFDPRRAAQAIDCIAQGLSAVHEVGVIHRDLTPNKVLGSGTGRGETFKITDFGVARPIGLTSTFAGAFVGTPGYAAPEIQGFDERVIGTWTDVFALAGVIYFILTGEPYFDAKSDVLGAVVRPARRSILDAATLHPTLRAHEHACKSIDLVLAWASAADPQSRLGEALAVSAMVVPHLRDVIDAEPPTVRASGVPVRNERSQPPAWTWTRLHHPLPGTVIRSVAWDGYGRCIAATNHGLSFWNGTHWHKASLEGIRDAEHIRFVRRVGAGRWLVGGEGATLAVCNTGGVTARIQGPEGAARFDLLSGDLDDITVLVAPSADGVPSLHAFLGKRWLKPLRLPGVAAVSALSRVDDTHWMITGRSATGGFAALYAPLAWELEQLPAPPDVRAFLACKGQPTRGLGIASGLEGAVLWREGATTAHEIIDGRPDLSAVAIDPASRGWAGGAGAVWFREPRADGGSWRRVWEDRPTPDGRTPIPIVSLFCDSGVVVAIAADGGIVEGRSNEVLDEPTNTTV